MGTVLSLRNLTCEMSVLSASKFKKGGKQEAKTHTIRIKRNTLK